MIICIILTVGAFLTVGKIGSKENICNYNYLED
jgi:hypothetical protein